MRVEEVRRSFVVDARVGGRRVLRTRSDETSRSRIEAGRRQLAAAPVAEWKGSSTGRSAARQHFGQRVERESYNRVGALFLVVDSRPNREAIEGKSRRGLVCLSQAQAQVERRQSPSREPCSPWEWVWLWFWTWVQEQSKAEQSKAKQSRLMESAAVCGTGSREWVWVWVWAADNASACIHSSAMHFARRPPVRSRPWCDVQLMPAQCTVSVSPGMGP